MNGQQILDIQMRANDAKAGTVRDYLKALLRTLWSEGESFSGKRPFGNSGWDRELLKPLIVAGAVKGELDEDGCVEDVDEKSATNAIFAAIEALH